MGNSLTNFDNSELHVFVVNIFSFGIQCWYTHDNSAMAAWPLGVSSPPISTRSAFIRSSMADPSAKNSGFDRIS